MKYKKIITHYEKCFDKHGDTALGMDWPDENDAKLRHEVMSELMKYTGNILDFGCGTGHFLEFLKDSGIIYNSYTGLELYSN